MCSLPLAADGSLSLDDIEHFAEFTGDTFYAHMDAEAAARNPFFPGRVAHGYLLLSFAAGLFVQADEGPVLANTGLDKVDERLHSRCCTHTHRPLRRRLVVSACR